MKEFPRIKKLGVEVHPKPVAHVKYEELKKVLGERMGEFSKLFGVQTCLMEGPYAWDVEAVLERMATGRVTGSQRDWD